jgi:drug/metabolite transporter (DMT)-like permease
MKKRPAVFLAVLAALLYAVSTPFSKVLLEHMPSTMLASLLYFGAGLGIGILWVFTPGKAAKRKNNLEKKDFYTHKMPTNSVFTALSKGTWCLVGV